MGLNLALSEFRNGLCSYMRYANRLLVLMLIVRRATITPVASNSVPLHRAPAVQPITPLSPTHYVQPPTPEHPPPNALQAERCIHERIRPLSQVGEELEVE